MPAKPKVTAGAKCYGRSKRGGYIITRFFVTQYRLGAHKDNYQPTDPWFVIDLEGREYCATGTKKEGYPNQEKAIKIAQRYRDEYGAWTVLPF